MKRPLSIALLTLSLSAMVIAPVQAGGHGHYGRGNYYGNGVNGWAAAAIGAVVGVALGAALTAPAPTYYPQAVAVPQPVVVTPAPMPYYVQQRACQPVQIPVYDQYGRLVQYQTACAN
jgi:hypothetical protein